MKYSQDPPLIKWDYRRLDAISQTGVVRNGNEVVVRLILEQTRHRVVNYPGLSVFGFSKFLHVALCQFECGTYPRRRTCSPHRRLSLRHHIKSSPCLVASTSRRGLSSLSTALKAQLYRSCIYVCLFGYGFWFS